MIYFFVACFVNQSSDFFFMYAHIGMIPCGFNRALGIPLWKEKDSGMRGELSRIRTSVIDFAFLLNQSVDGGLSVPFPNLFSEVLSPI